MPTATRLFRVQLAAQLLGDQVVFVPELNDSAVRNASHHRASWSAPVRGQNRLPDDQNGQLVGFLLLQYLFRCGGPPQTTRSCWRQKKYHSDVRYGAVELDYEQVVAREARQRRLTLRVIADHKKYQARTSMKASPRSANNHLLFAIRGNSF